MRRETQQDPTGSGPRFEPALEIEFQAESFRNSITTVRFGLLLAIVLYALFGVLDRYMLPLTQETAWVIRYAIVVPVLTAVLLATFAGRFERVFTPTLTATSLLLGAGILAMMYRSEATEPGYEYYYSGLMLVILWIGTFSQLGFRPVLQTVVAIILGFAFVGVFEHGMVAGGFDNPDLPVFINNSFFLVSAAILAVFSSHAFEKGKRKAFLQRREISREREKTQKLLEQVEALLGQHVSRAVADELVGRSGQLDSRLCDVTVMFLDIRDFTAFADSRPPSDVASFQNAVFSELIEIIQAHRGVINQILGDGVMATFGAPVSSTTHVSDAVAAGRAILEAVRDLGASGRIPVIRVGIGLHTGQVLAGNIGTESRKQYSLTGITVNVAARIEQLNKTYGSQFLVSGEVHGRMGSPETAEDLGEVQLRGTRQPIRIFRLA